MVWLLLAFFALDWFRRAAAGISAAHLALRMGALWLAKVLGWVGGWLAVFALAYMTAMLLAAIFIVPLLAQIGDREYPDGTPRRRQHRPRPRTA